MASSVINFNNFLKNPNPSQIINSGNLNDLHSETEGRIEIYYLHNTNLTNIPESSYGWLFSFFQSINTEVQIFIANSGNIYKRVKSGASWIAWEKI